MYECKYVCMSGPLRYMETQFLSILILLQHDAPCRVNNEYPPLLHRASKHGTSMFGILCLVPIIWKIIIIIIIKDDTTNTENIIYTYVFCLTSLLPKATCIPYIQ